MPDFQQPQGRNPAIIIILVLLIILVIIGIILMITFYEPSPKGQTDPTIPTYTINMMCNSDYEENIECHYNLYNGGINEQQGTIFPKKVEQFTKARNDTTYRVLLKADGHYDNEVICTYKERCNIVMNRIANITGETFSFPDRQALVIGVDRGTLHDAKLCLTWSMDIFDMVINDLNSSVIPRRLEALVDRCYSLGNVSSGYYFYDVFTTFENTNVPNHFEYWIVDKCFTGWDEGCSNDFRQKVNI